MIETKRRSYWPPASAAVLALAALGIVPDSQAGSLLNACFAPDALNARPGEATPVKGDHRFDKPPADDGTLARAANPVASALRGAIRRVDLPPKSRKLVALTLDLCEQPGERAGYDGAIIDYLRANNIKATLFAGGKWMRSHEDRTRQLMADPRFELANHSEAHRNLRLLSGAALQNEIAGPQQAYEGIRTRFAAEQCVRADPAAAGAIPPGLSLFRFPYGACNQASLDAVNDAGLLAIQWDLSTGDPSPAQSAKAIAEEMIRHAKPGSIIIAHANGRGYHTAAGLPLAIPALRAKGFEFVTVSELLSAGKPVIAPTCYDSRPGDTDRYDHPLALRHPIKSQTLGGWVPTISKPAPATRQ